MATVKPFRAWRYNRQVIRNMASVLAPPYDVIDGRQYISYAARSPHNIIHLTLAGAPFSPDPYLSRYPRAADYWQHWRDEGIFLQDPAPAIYVYEQEYEDALRGHIQRRAYIATVKLHDYEERVVLPHEEIRTAVRTDRLAMLRACQASFSQVFGLFSDPDGAAEQIFASQTVSEAGFEVSDDEGVVHRMAPVTDPQRIVAFAEMLSDKQIVIADGHHRYSAALAYRDQMSADQPTASDPPWDYVSMLLCPANPDTLTILPSHRMIRSLPHSGYEYLKDPGAGIFQVSSRELPAGPADRSSAVRDILTEMHQLGGQEHVFGLYTGDDVVQLIAAPRGASSLGDFAPERSRAWRQLDLAVLHRIIIERLMGLTERYAESQKNILFTDSAEDAIAKVDIGEAAVTFLINPPRVKDVMQVAKAGDPMPQKGTHFYPKPLAGVAIYDLRA